MLKRQNHCDLKSRNANTITGLVISTSTTDIYTHMDTRTHTIAADHKTQHETEVLKKLIDVSVHFVQNLYHEAK